MNIVTRFNRTFGLTSDIEAERRKFIQRINETAFRIVENISYPFEYPGIYKWVCFLLGENATDRIRAANGPYSWGYHTCIPQLRTLTNNEFVQTLAMICYIFDYFKDFERGADIQKKIDVSVQDSISLSQVDIGVRWKSGMFYKSGAKELDEKLFEEPFEWLAEFPDEKKDLREALQSYYQGNLNSVIHHCYNAVEGLSRKILKNDKTLQNNIKPLQERFNWSEELGKLFSVFFHWSNELQRHASENRHQLKEDEIESYLYTTGLLARAILKGHKG
ncbi:MAG: hypothetical protein PHX87_04615 [Candidatus Peribacteraceae bacterium]|nr:hypothetical protein [Candidatus Peribacteraceae bacterium]MDD5742680.1 hypothetical protein [Candidatus Peribacteraceae bacterium]